MAGDLGSIVIFWSRFPQQDTIKSLDEYQFLRTEKQSSLKCETQINSHNGRCSKAQALLCGQAASPLRILRAAGWVSRWKMLCWTWFNSSSYTCGGRLVCNDCWLVWAKIERDHRTVDGRALPQEPTLSALSHLALFYLSLLTSRPDQVFPHLSNISI